MTVDEEKKKRLSVMRQIHPLARQDHRHFLTEKGKDGRLRGLPRNERRLLAKGGKKLAAQYRNILRDIASSGAGFPVDRLIRQLAVEYTHRYPN